MGVRELADEIRSAVNNNNSHAVRGYISGSLVVVGTSSYPYTAAVDCNTNDGDYVWCNITKSGMAVIVGA
jgi:hypothetical protein